MIRQQIFSCFQDAVEMIRTKRRGAINTKQLEFLSKYRKTGYFVKVLTYLIRIFCMFMFCRERIGFARSSKERQASW